MKIIANNKKATFEYEILDKYEAGIKLQGTEVKSISNCFKFGNVDKDFPTF